MSVIEIVGGVILLIVSAAIVFLTLMQHTHGQGLSGAINGSAYGANNARLTPADQMLAKVTRIAGIVFLWWRSWPVCLQAVWPEHAYAAPCRTGLFFCPEIPKIIDDSLREAAASGMRRRRQEGSAGVCPLCEKARSPVEAEPLEVRRKLCLYAIKLNMRSKTSPAPSRI